MTFDGGEWTLSERSPRHKRSRTTRGVVRTRGASLILVGALASHASTAVVIGGDATHVLAAAIPPRIPLVFRVEGSSADPEYRRACRVVEGLEDLYGNDRYRLQQDHGNGAVEVVMYNRIGTSAKVANALVGALELHEKILIASALVLLRAPAVDLEIPSLPNQQRWLPRWLSNFAGLPRANMPLRTFPPVHCSVECWDGWGSARGETGGPGGNGNDDAAPEEHVVIGGVEELLEFVRGSVLAGPRPVSPAFHQQSLSLGGSTATEPRGDSRSHTDASSLSRGSGSGDPNCQCEQDYEFDLVVVGGGSGGLACAKEAARLGRKVACLDFVKPSPQGTTWGLGGTCVNVGCIPKKLMHQAALLGGQRKDAAFFGWREGFTRSTERVVDGNGDGDEDRGRSDHDWEKMMQSVQDYIKGLNFGYRTDLRSKGVEYLNALGRLEDAHTVIATDKNGKERIVTCGAVVLAVGGRPKRLDCEGGDLAITSDDIFSLKRSPGRVLVVGASYVALECAGFLTGLGMDTTVMVRSILLRGFDQAMAERVGRFMEAEGTRFLRPAAPHRILRTAGGRLLVSWRDEGDEVLREEEFDTVLAATGRTADISGLGLRATGVELGKSGKILCTNEETTTPSVFALGDAVEGVPELTPSAIQAGRLLARRLFGGSVEAMDYRNVCTTVFTPLEYACCGMSEEDAVRLLGEDRVEVYHSAFTPLEWQLNPERPQNACYVKAVCDLQDRHRLVGLHLLGPHAGEVMQGFGLGIRLGMAYDDLRQLVGIHPTVAEELTLLEITKRSGESIGKSAC